MSSSSISDDAVNSEVLGAINTATGYLAESIPENTYWAFSTYTYIAPEILKAFTKFALPQSSASGPSWNYIDSIMQGFLGLRQIMDTSTHRPDTTKFKGIFNCSASLQLAILTGISATTLGPIGFAVGFGVSFTLSLDDLTRSVRRVLSPDYWLKDSLAQYDKLHEQLDLVKEETDHLQSKKPQGELANWALNQKFKRKDEIEKQIKEIENEIEARINIDYLENKTTKHMHSIIEEHYKKKNDDYYEKLHMFKYKKDTTLPKLKPKPLAYIEDEITNKPPALELLEEYKLIRNKGIRRDKIAVLQTAMDTVMLGVAFTGMLLMCIPGAQLPAIILMGIASSMFIAKNSVKIAKGVKNFVNYMKEKNRTFSDKTPTPRGENDAKFVDDSKIDPKTTPH